MLPRGVDLEVAVRVDDFETPAGHGCGMPSRGSPKPAHRSVSALDEQVIEIARAVRGGSHRVRRADVRPEYTPRGLTLFTLEPKCSPATSSAVQSTARQAPHK